MKSFRQRGALKEEQGDDGAFRGAQARMRKPRRVVRSNEQRAAVKEEHGDTGGFQQRGDKYERGSTGAKERGEEYSAAPRAIVFRGCQS